MKDRRLPATANVTRLGYALLGLIRSEPRTGYALRMVFETTPLGTFSSSPGSIYPALAGLGKAGLVERRDAGPGRSLFGLTPAGEAVLDAWLAAPVDEAEVAHRRDTALLRFAFLQDHPDRSLALGFLESFEAAAWAYAASLEAFLDGEEGRALTLQGRLAVGHGLEGTRASARWAADARRQLIEAMEGETGS